MLTLAFDTTANGVSVAVLRDKDIVAQDYRAMVRGQGEALIPMIQRLIQQADLYMADLDQVAVTVGPGSFTGVRVGLAAARGIGLALKIPVRGITTLAASAYGTTGRILAVLDTKRGDFYTQLFQDGTPLEGPAIRTAKQIQALFPVALVGTGVAPLSDVISCTTANPAEALAVPAGLLSLDGGLPAEPIYLRDADVSI